MFTGPFDYSIVKRASTNSLIQIVIHDLRKWTATTYKSVDDHPFGGGAGMLMMVEPIYKAINHIKSTLQGKTHIILTSAKGNLFTQQKAISFSQDIDNLVIICGHYEGVDDRVATHLVDEEISVGKYILSGGEIPAMLITDAITRLLPGAIGNQESLNEESYNEENLTEYPQYTRPAIFVTENGDEWKVPDVLLSGNHKLIAEWRKQQQRKL
jgi:tRNA (guanine37-N1)-methyltransferase